MTAGRPRKLEDEAIVETCMHLFWQKGYDKTSMADVLAATGLHKGSIYKAFKDKKSLFMSVLEHYLDDMFKQLEQLANEEPDARIALRKLLSHMLEHGSNTKGDQHVGCLAVNSLVNRAPFDEDVAAIMQTKRERIFSLFGELVARVRDTTPAAVVNLEVDQVVRLFATLMCGLSVELRNDLDTDSANEIMQQQLSLLGL